MKSTICVAAASLLAVSRAYAQDVEVEREITLEEEPDGDGAFAVFVGTDSAFDGNPATIRLTAQGVGDLIDGDLVSLAAVVPVTFMTGGDDSFGFSSRQTVLELPPSLRARFLSSLPVRPYADLGLGLAAASRSEESWLLEDHENVLGWMTRATLGVELGDEDGLMVMVEPLSWQTYHLGGSYGRLAGMIGVGSRF
jgi:hypothetical protein